MKEFRKNEQNFFICEECNKSFKYKKGLSKHINVNHNIKEYYDKWLKEDGEGLCKICNRETNFTGLKHCYENCCCKNCKNKYRHLRIEEENIKNFGVKNSYQRKDIKLKIKNTLNKKYGGYTFQSNELKEKVENTNFKKYKNKFYKNFEKQKQTKLIKYGDEHYHNIKKIKETNILKYGIENPNQNLEIFTRGERTRLKSHNYLNTNIHYRGKYELDFLEKYFNKLDIKNSPSIKYVFEFKNKIYFPDFYIPSLNLIIEIKNSYLAKRDKLKIEEKRKATIANGFNYIMIINKNYINFNELLKVRLR
jgi:uncharacterized C2H2 Zn-finger protein